MNCLPLLCVKFYIIITGLLVVATGCVGIWLGVQFEDSSYADALDYEWLAFVIILIGAIVILCGITGIVGTCYKVWMTFAVVTATQFSIIAFVVGTILIIIGSVTLYVQVESDDWLDDEEDCKDNFDDAHDASVKASELLCQPYCPCDLSAKNLLEIGLIGAYIGSAEDVQDCKPCENIDQYNTDEYNEVRLFITRDLELDWDDCLNNKISSEDVVDEYFDDEERKNLDFLKWAEEKFNCAGMCVKNDFYMFSDIDDNNKPDEACREEINDWIEENFLAFGIICLFCGVLLLIIPLCTAGLWCPCCRRKDFE